MARSSNVLNFGKVVRLKLFVGAVMLGTKSPHHIGVVVAEALPDSSLSDVATNVFLIVGFLARSFDLSGHIEHSHFLLLLFCQIQYELLAGLLGLSALGD